MSKSQQNYGLPTCIYRCLFIWKEGFSGMARWMQKQSAEEIGHAYAIAEYMIKREATPKVDKVDVVPQGWGNPVEVFEHALEHEKHVSKLIDELVQVASEEKDNATQNFLWQFVREQVEEEANVLNIVSRLRKAGDSAILLWMQNWVNGSHKPE